MVDLSEGKLIIINIDCMVQIKRVPASSCDALVGNRYRYHM